MLALTDSCRNTTLKEKHNFTYTVELLVNFLAPVLYLSTQSPFMELVNYY